MKNQFNNIVEKRRSIYALGKDIPVSREEIESIIKHSVMHTPSAFNNQTNRVVVLFDNNHEKLWDIAHDCLKPLVDAESFKATEEKLNMFKQGYASILFYEDTDTVKRFENDYAPYKANFEPWAQQTSAIVQYIVWTHLAEAGIGANLQHYNPLIDEKVAAEFNIPASWKLVAQMNIGSIKAPAGEKETLPVEETVKII